MTGLSGDARGAYELGAIDGSNKKPRGRCGGANFSLLSKEVTADSVLGYRNIVVLDLDLFVFVIIVLLASKSCQIPARVTDCSHTSLGHNNISKTRANLESIILISTI